MISKPSNWDDVISFTEKPRLQPGGYVCRIKRAYIRNNSYGDQLIVEFDIDEGEYKGYFEEDYKNNTNPNRYWRGVYKPFLPREDGSEKDSWTKANFKAFITSVEHSNVGYMWDWDENSLANKRVGVIFRSEEWSFSGKHGWTARAYRACSVDTIRTDSFRVPEPKALTGKKNNNGSNEEYSPYVSGFVSAADFHEANDVDDDDLPF